ncbi:MULTISPECIES: hypothetical protein [unclassified Caballeronia]|uniref:hypothetical protein n=1 Tax=unclassified Caballeronia TaxID=2646786 RepID=UPI002865A4BE|nr:MULTISPECIES: hypothetical protein [unclassified Caballeronia]MDR5752541.1 hypothetical protein [Caballeronia sp. LZ024]MDR5841697.1 hypothetical protein [Caballeronia sp. LZ031]
MRPGRRRVSRVDTGQRSLLDDAHGLHASTQQFAPSSVSIKTTMRPRFGSGSRVIQFREAITIMLSWPWGAMNDRSASSGERLGHLAAQDPVPRLPTR